MGSFATCFVVAASESEPLAPTEYVEYVPPILWAVGPLVSANRRLPLGAAAKPGPTPDRISSAPRTGTARPSGVILNPAISELVTLPLAGI